MNLHALEDGAERHAVGGGQDGQSYGLGWDCPAPGQRCLYAAIPPGRSFGIRAAKGQHQLRTLKVGTRALTLMCDVRHRSRGTNRTDY
jgi:hypothetical protein